MVMGTLKSEAARWCPGLDPGAGNTGEVWSRVSYYNVPVFISYL